METVKVSSKGQIVIPKAVPDAKHITAGTEVAVSVVGEELRLTPLHGARQTSVKEVAGMLARPWRRKLSEAEERRRIARAIAHSDRASKR
jgi:AbrB family looped-hinge helix DNA binding protein